MSRNEMPENENASSMTTTTITTTSSSSSSSSPSIGITDNTLLMLTLQKSQRLCHIVKRPDFDGYGFNLHSEKGKPGQYIGKVDDNSPAEKAGLREGDRIIEVNGADIGSETHKQVVQRIKAIACEVRLLVIDPNKEKEILKDEKIEMTTSSTLISTSNNNQNISNGNNLNITIPTEIESIENSVMSSKNESVPSSPMSKINISHNNNIVEGDFTDNHEISIKSTENSSRNSTSSMSTSPSGAKNYQTNVQFLVNESQIEYTPATATITFDDNEPTENHSTNLNSNNNHTNKTIENIQMTTTSSIIDTANGQTKNQFTNLMTTKPENPTKINIDSSMMKQTSTVEPNSTTNSISIKNQLITTTIDENSSGNGMGAVPKTTIPESPGTTGMQKTTSTVMSTSTTTTTTTTTTATTNNNNINKKSSLNLPMTAAEMRAKLLAKKKYDPKNDSVDLRKKFEIIQKL